MLSKLLKKIRQILNLEKETVYEHSDETEIEIRSLWDFFQINENTQAYHLINVLGYDEWIDMREIRRRIKEIFNVEYKNERSLYPYLKTLTDINLVETTSAGGRRKWRKKELLLEIEHPVEKKIEIRVAGKTQKKPLRLRLE